MLNRTGLEKKQFKNILLVLDHKSNCKPAFERILGFAKENHALLKIIDTLKNPFNKIEFGPPSVMEEIITEKRRKMEKVQTQRFIELKNLVKTPKGRG